MFKGHFLSRTNAGIAIGLLPACRLIQLRQILSSSTTIVLPILATILSILAVQSLRCGTNELVVAAIAANEAGILLLAKSIPAPALAIPTAKSSGSAKAAPSSTKPTTCSAKATGSTQSA